jgi:hypothetical protein
MEAVFAETFAEESVEPTQAKFYSEQEVQERVASVTDTIIRRLGDSPCMHQSSRYYKKMSRWDSHSREDLHSLERVSELQIHAFERQIANRYLAGVCRNILLIYC